MTYCSESVGGPTLATNQRLAQDDSRALASKGWMVAPKLNRMVTFDATVLHGVIPGRGLPRLLNAAPLPPPAATAETVGGEKTENETKSASPAARTVGGTEETKHVPSRRLTFMVGFWRTIAATDRGLDNPGPGQPFPDRNRTAYSWPAEMEVSALKDAVVNGGDEGRAAAAAACTTTAAGATESDGGPFSSRRRPVVPIPLNCIWERVDAGLSAQELAAAVHSYNSGGGSGISSVHDMTAALNKRRKRVDESPHYSACFQGF